MGLMNRLFIKIFAVFCFVLLFICQANASVGIKNMRIGNQSDGARVVFDMNKSINYRVFLLDDPQRVVVDLDDADIAQLYTKTSNQVIKQTRIGKMSGSDKRVVLELSRPATVKKAFLIPPQSGQDWRLVVDLVMTDTRTFHNKIGNKYMLTNNAQFAPDTNDYDEQPVEKSVSKANCKRIIVLDPGHGGKDPGAIGAYHRTYEKNITLSMGKELKQILQNKGYIVYLTRETDIFIPLRQRIKIAQQRKRICLCRFMPTVPIIAMLPGCLFIRFPIRLRTKRPQRWRSVKIKPILSAVSIWAEIPKK